MPKPLAYADDRTPATGSLAALAIALLVAGALFGGMEAFWRSHGHVPSVVDDMQLWAMHRDRARGGDAIALVGWSRSLYDIAPHVVREMYPDHRLANLAVTGKTPYATLEDLANDEDFAGLVVVDTTHAHLLRRFWPDQEPWVRYRYNNWTIAHRVERRVASVLQANLVAVHPKVSLKELLGGVFGGQWPEPMHVTTNAERWMAADLEKVDWDAMRAKLEKRGAAEDAGEGMYDIGDPDDPKHVAAVERYSELSRQIRARGGEVVFIRLPTGINPPFGGPGFAKHPGWVVFAEHIDAPAIHFADVESLSGYWCYDSSHLDATVAPRFTRALFTELAKQGLLPPPRE